MNQILSFLSGSSGSSDRCIPGSVLTQMGKTAAMKFVSEQAPLNATIYEMAEKNALNPEQTRRIVETANTETFLMVKSAGYEGNIDFPVADYAAIAALRTSKPDQEKKASAAQDLESYLDGIIVSGGSEKTASTEPENSNPFFELFTVNNEETEKYAEAGNVVFNNAEEYDRAVEDIGLLLSEATAKQERLYEEFTVGMRKLAALITDYKAEGYPEDQLVASILLTKEASPQLIEYVFEGLGDTLTHDAQAIEKIAFQGLMVAPGNAVTGLVQDLNEMSTKLMAASQAVAQAQQGVDLLRNVLQGPNPMPGTEAQFGGPQEASGGPPQLAQLGAAQAPAAPPGPPQLGAQTPPMG